MWEDALDFWFWFWCYCDELNLGYWIWGENPSSWVWEKVWEMRRNRSYSTARKDKDELTTAEGKISRSLKNSQEKIFVTSSWFRGDGVDLVRLGSGLFVVVYTWAVTMRRWREGYGCAVDNGTLERRLGIRDGPDIIELQWQQWQNIASDSTISEHGVLTTTCISRTYSTGITNRWSFVEIKDQKHATFCRSREVKYHTCFGRY